MITLTLKNVWQAPGYRYLTLVMIDPKTQKEYELQLPPQDVHRMIFECATAVKQIGKPHPPIDWEQYPVQIRWPNIEPWMAGPPPSHGAIGGTKIEDKGDKT